MDKLTIASYGPTARECEIYLNEMQLKTVKSLTLYLSADSVSEATLEIMLDEVHIDAEAFTNIIAHAGKVIVDEPGT